MNEYEMMETFCYSITNKKIQEDLLYAIQEKGAFGRFKTAVHCHNIENKWYKFREECIIEIAIAKQILQQTRLLRALYEYLTLEKGKVLEKPDKNAMAIARCRYMETELLFSKIEAIAKNLNTTKEICNELKGYCDLLYAFQLAETIFHLQDQ